MKKIINHSVLLLLLACLPAVAQNTATTSGNWDNCATWGDPTSIFNVTTDTKTINTGVAIVQNTTWSTNNINFGTGNGSVSFADATKSIDFVSDAGADKSCTPPSIGFFNCSTGVLTGSLTSQTPASGVSKTVSYSGGNNAPYPAGIPINSTGVTGLTATLRAGTLASGSGNLVYDIAGTPSGSGTATFAVNFAGKSCNITISVASTVIFDNSSCNLNEANGWVFTGSWYHYADVYRNGGSCLIGGDPNNNSSIGWGMAYKTFATVAGITYKVTVASRHVGYTNTQNTVSVYAGTATSGTHLGRVNTTAGENSFNVINTFTFTATSATSTLTVTEYGGTSYNSDQYLQAVSITY
ncbi:hypothetical protein [uncultured Flavobacterium sp.]|uniref:hypothetical protein n=1 Tax=uncultured Flavobacterium sp. TaxID=165435 RepID=UPI0025E53BD2|nr:hypothetical protein [uncultured Flavobacterium sp.]